MVSYSIFRAAFLQFLHFGFWSGLGWLCDFFGFLLLVSVFDASGFMANFISSYVGITFVWFTSLNRVFDRTSTPQTYFLITYWVVQFFSILAYSHIIQLVVDALGGVSYSVLMNNPEISAKVIVTPFNLVSNFLFMKFLTRFMQHARTTR